MTHDTELSVEYVDSESIAVLTMNRPEKHNPLSRSMQGSIVAALDEGVRKGTSVTIIRGAGDAFSAGYDLDPTKRESYLVDRDIVADRAGLLANRNFLRRVFENPGPVIAQVHGYCLAGGTELMMSSDIAVAARDAQIGLPPVRNGGTSIMWPMWGYNVGLMRTKLMAFTGDSITGDQAQEWGVVAYSIEENELSEYVLGLARRIAMIPLDILTLSKDAVNRGAEAAGVNSAIANGVDLDVIGHFTPPARKFWDQAVEEGLKQALETRDAPFRGGHFSMGTGRDDD